jgi:hypothetical protein
MVGGVTMVRQTQMHTSVYDVVVSYREPTYEAHAGPKAEPYRWTYRIRASSEADAARGARRQFDEAQRLSSVGWARTVVGIEIISSKEGRDP